jgi:uncharacterized protein (TIRG00374 family)
MDAPKSVTDEVVPSGQDVSLSAHEAEEPAAPVPPALASRFLSKRTLISIAAALAIVVIAVIKAPINWGDAWQSIKGADLRLYGCALVAYYLSFLVRGLRWKVLLANAGEERHLGPLTLIVITSFFVNCVVPAKMGDIYRAYLGRIKQHISGTLALGTIIAERIIDLCVLMALLLISGAYVFHRHAPGVLVPYLIGGSLVCVAGVLVLWAMRVGRGTRLLNMLPEAIFHRYEKFRLGAVTSLGRYPTLLSLTVLVWAFEAMRLGFVVYALGLDALVGPSQFLLIALVAALLTTVPFLPGGIGLVEAGMVGVLTLVAGLNNNDAIAVALLDRSISYGSLVVLGFIVFAITHLHVPGHHPTHQHHAGEQIG